jgi:hypothetical protein
MNVCVSQTLAQKYAEAAKKASDEAAALKLQADSALTEEERKELLKQAEAKQNEALAEAHEATKEGRAEEEAYKAAITKKAADRAEFVKRIEDGKSNIQNGLLAVDKLCNNISGFMDSAGFGVVSDLITNFEVVAASIKAGTTSIKKIKNTITGKLALAGQVADSIKSTFRETQTLFEEIISTPQDIWNAIQDIGQDWVDMVEEVKNLGLYFNELFSSVSSVEEPEKSTPPETDEEEEDTLPETDEPETMKLIPQYIIDDQALSIEDCLALVAEQVDTLTSIVNSLLTDIYQDALIICDNHSYLQNSFSTITLTGKDTPELIAQKFFGSPEYASDILAYNNISSFDDKGPGTTLRIPLPLYKNNSRNHVFNFSDYDFLGRDIAIDDRGFILTTGSDISLIKGADNLKQAILLRLRENITKRIRLFVYGIRTTIADPLAGVNFITGSIYNTVIQDPRIQSVDDITFHTRGDAIFVSLSYTSISGLSSTITHTF